jgi:hypothetical protein
MRGRAIVLTFTRFSNKEVFMVETTIAKGSAWSFPTTPRTVEFGGSLFTIQPVVSVRPILGLRWILPLLAQILHLDIFVHVHGVPVRAPGFTYEQVMARSADTRLPAAASAKS